MNKITFGIIIFTFGIITILLLWLWNKTLKETYGYTYPYRFQDDITYTHYGKCHSIAPIESNIPKVPHKDNVYYRDFYYKLPSEDAFVELY